MFTRRLTFWFLAVLVLMIATQGMAKDKHARIGVLMLSEDTKNLPWHKRFVEVLQARGWIVGNNLEIEYRYAQGEGMQFDQSAAELAGMKIDVLFAVSAPASRAAFQHTKSIPIVALDFSSDPIAMGYAQSYARPGKNVTGVFLDAPELAGKWVEALRSLLPRMKRVALLWDRAPGAVHLDAITRAAKGFKLRTEVHEVRSPSDLEPAVAASSKASQALIILPSPLTFTHSKELADFALKYKLPAIAMFRVFAKSGGALAYGPVLQEGIERNAAMVATILDGTKPGDLPLERPMKFDFVYNMKTMKALNLKVPDSLLLGAELVEN